MTDQLKDKVMAMIQKRGVSMRPRWHFILLSALAAAGALILIVLLLYVTSLALFFMRINGGWYAPSFGGRGWIVLLQSAPVLLLGLVALFAVILEVLVRKYSFAYRTPLLMSLGGILLIIFVGGFTIAQTSLHHRLEQEAHRGRLPPPFTMWYKAPFRVPPPGDMYRGVIMVRNETGFVMADFEDGTSTVQITPKTRFPYGMDFAPGDFVIVVGDMHGTDTIRAFGVRPVKDER
jgi:hypothetical protein